MKSFRRRLVGLVIFGGIAASVAFPPWAHYRGGVKAANKGHHSLLWDSPFQVEVDLARLGLQIAGVLAVGGLLWTLLPSGRPGGSSLAEAARKSGSDAEFVAFSIRELERIELATRDDPIIRALVAQEIRNAWTEAQARTARNEGHEGMVEMLKAYTVKRQLAANLGAQHHGDHRWAPFAAVESWLQVVVEGPSLEELDQIHGALAKLAGGTFPPES